MKARNTVASRITSVLEQEIESGIFGPEGRFPTERDLALRFDVARNTIRRAMTTLESKGKLIRQVGRGTFVSPRSNAMDRIGDEAIILTQEALALPEESRPSLSAETISPKNLIDARIVLEPAIAAAAATNATDVDIQELLELQRLSEQSMGMTEFERHDAALHKKLFSISGNPLIDAVETILAEMRTNAEWLTAKRRAYSPNQKARYVAEHRAIVDAISERTPGAAREAMCHHLESVRLALLQQ